MNAPPDLAVLSILFDLIAELKHEARMRPSQRQWLRVTADSADERVRGVFRNDE